MKTFKQIVNESRDPNPGTKSHFTHHAKGWLSHTEQACKIEDRKGLPMGNSDHHWDQAEKHEKALTRHYGQDAFNHVMNNVGSKKDADAAWTHVQGK